MSIRIMMILVISLLITACGDFGLFSPPQAFSEKTLSGSGTDKVALIHITGVISSIPKEGIFNSHPSILQEVTAQLRLAQKDTSVKAIILAINSPGGSVTASDILYNEINRIRMEGNKKIYTLMMDVAASGGYYIALASHSIMAHPTSITGSIGVIVTRISIAETLKSIGVETSTVTSGAMKDMGSILRKPTPEETNIVRAIVDSMNTRFQHLVTENRPQAQAHTLYKDGRILTANQALDMGLIDSIGYFEDTLTQIKKELNIEKVKVVTYRRTDLPDGTEYSNMSMKLGEERFIPEAFSLEAGFHYLWLPNTL